MNSVMSATQRSLGAEAEKSRFKRSGAGATSRRPRRHFLRECTPTSSASAMRRHPFAADPGADPAELAVDARRSIGRSRALVDVADGVGQIGVINTAWRWRPTGPDVVVAAGDLGDPAQGFDRVLVSVSGDESKAA
jgi:hypothetical protein